MITTFTRLETFGNRSTRWSWRLSTRATRTLFEFNPRIVPTADADP